MANHRVAVVVPADFTLFELGVAVEAFATAPRPELAQDWYDVAVCTARPGPAAAGGLFDASIPHGVEILAEADTVIVPQAQPSLEEPDPLVLDALRAAYQRGTRMISFCTGAFVLAAAGILDGRPATTHWKYTRRLALQHPRVRVNPDVLYIDDGQVLTSAGTAAGIDLSLHVIGKDHGARTARLVAREMVVAPHRAGGQAQFVVTPVPEVRDEDAISRTMSHVLTNLEADLSIDELSALAFMSPRNFTRRFRDVTGTTPARWVFHQRLARARELLEETDLPIETIAARTGFGSSVTLRQRFASTLRTSPSAYRRSFRDGFGPYQDVTPGMAS
jgi:AraC family transcriptional regulator, transcriptional activator FtrA